jgi:Amt family ammonium transporter
MTFAVITVALVAGSVADRMRFSAYLWFVAGWLMLVYVPIAHWVWGGGFLATAGVLDFAGGTVVHLNAGIAGLVACTMIGARRGYGTDNLAPYDLSLAVIGTGLLWVGWFGFNGGSALAANSRAGFAMLATHLAACAGVLTWMALEGFERGKPSVLGTMAFAGGATAGILTLVRAVQPLRVSIDVELAGVDVAEHGEHAYHGGLGELTGARVPLGDGVLVAAHEIAPPLARPASAA